MRNKYLKFGFVVTFILVIGIHSLTDNIRFHALASEKSSRINCKYVSKNKPLSELDDLNKQWIDSFNSSAKEFETYYIKEALMIEKVKYYQGAVQLEKVYKKKAKSFHVTKFTVEYRAQLSENTNKVYEAGSFTTDTKKTYQYLFIWSKIDGEWKHELDSICQKSKDVPMDGDIDTARENWVTLSNEHSAIKLAKELYDKDFLYYNRGNIYADYESLASIYDYMNYTNYSVDLSNEYITMIQSDYSLDIGSWNSNGNSGKYIIIWKLVDGQWKIRLDTNW